MKILFGLLELLARQVNKNTAEIEDQGEGFARDIENLIDALEDTRASLAQSQVTIKASLERLDWCEAELEKNRIARLNFQLEHEVYAYENSIQNLR